VFYRPELFDRAGLNHPPKYYGERYQLPDGSEYDWNWDTFSYVARLLTIDVNGLNATEYAFDASQIVQYGYEPQWQSARQMTSFFGGQKLYSNGNSAIPWEARTAWKTYYDGMWGSQPFIPSGPTRSSAEFGSGNVFDSGRIGMAITQSWYLCCMGNILNTGGTFDFGALPSFNGVVYGRVDSESFRIMQSSSHPAEAFEVISYLTGPAAQKLNTIYVSTPARISDQESWLKEQRAKFPFVQYWDTLITGLNYADIPNADSYSLNFYEADERIATFMDLISQNKFIDLDSEINKLEQDLQVINSK
jgi:multiple sugar transport system substrate-binding protein